jgi:hypothetical protein
MHGDVPPPGLPWGRIALACLLSLLPLAPIGGLALTLAAELAEQARGGSRLLGSHKIARFRRG